MNLLASTLVYGGLLVTLTGAASLVRPVPFLGIESRRAASLVLGSGLALALAGGRLPGTEGPPVGRSRLDDFVPAYQFNERHEIRIQASPETVYGALRSVAARDILFYRTLTWIRSPRAPWAAGGEGVFAPPSEKPILDVFLRSGFLLLSEEAGREVVLGTVVCCGPSGVKDPRSFAELTRPGFAKAAVSFAVGEAEGGALLRTETRVWATDARALRRFNVYWRLIYPGSALLRRSWLWAVKRRAEV